MFPFKDASIFSMQVLEEHESFRATGREFLKRELEPHVRKIEETDVVDRNSGGLKVGKPIKKLGGNLMICEQFNICI